MISERGHGLDVYILSNNLIIFSKYTLSLLVSDTDNKFN